ncbi:MAG: type II secretion system F family protein [Acidimicrobiia bacterium]
MKILNILIELKKRRKEEHLQKNQQISNLYDLPYVYTLFSLCMSAGVSNEQSFKIVSRHVPESYAVIFEKARNEVDLGKNFDRVFEILSENVNLRSLSHLLRESYDTGVSCIYSLDLMHIDARNRIRRLYETSIKKVPVLTLFPLVFCILPSFVLLSVVPTLVDGLLKFNY